MISISRSHLSWAYVVLGVTAWVLTSLHLPGYLALGLVNGTEMFWRDALLHGNAAARFLTVDILMLAFAAMAWMVIESRARKMRGLAAYILLALFVGISLAFPLFLAARERQILRAQPGDTHITLSRADGVWIALLLALSLVGSAVTLMH